VETTGNVPIIQIMWQEFHGFPWFIESFPKYAITDL